MIPVLTCVPAAFSKGEVSLDTAVRAVEDGRDADTRVDCSLHILLPAPKDLQESECFGDRGWRRQERCVTLTDPLGAADGTVGSDMACRPLTTTALAHKQRKGRPSRISLRLGSRAAVVLDLQLMS